MAQMVAKGHCAGKGKPIVVESPAVTLVDGKPQLSGEDAYWLCMMREASAVKRVNWNGKPLDLCPECHQSKCDCITPEAQAALLARIDADPHGYNNLTATDIPF